GPMADTYAFALGGALLLAVTLSPVLCYLCFDTKWMRQNALGLALLGVAAILFAGYGIWRYEDCLVRLAQASLRWMIEHVTWVMVSLMVAFVLFLLWLEAVRSGRENLLVRGLRAATLWLLELFLQYRVVYLTAVAVLVFLTAIALPFLGQEFMPTLEEGN